MTSKSLHSKPPTNLSTARKPLVCGAEDLTRQGLPLEAQVAPPIPMPPRAQAASQQTLMTPTPSLMMMKYQTRTWMMMSARTLEPHRQPTHLKRPQAPRGQRHTNASLSMKSLMAMAPQRTQLRLRKRPQARPRKTHLISGLSLSTKCERVTQQQ